MVYKQKMKVKDSHDSFLFMLRQTILASSRVTTAAPKAFVSAPLRLDYTTVKRQNYVGSWPQLEADAERGCGLAMRCEAPTPIFSYFSSVREEVCKRT